MNKFRLLLCILCTGVAGAQITLINQGPLEIVAHFSKPPYRYWRIPTNERVVLDQHDPWIIIEWEHHLVHYYSPKQVADDTTYLVTFELTQHNEYTLVFTKLTPPG